MRRKLRPEPVANGKRCVRVPCIFIVCFPLPCGGLPMVDFICYVPCFFRAANLFLRRLGLLLVLSPYVGSLVDRISSPYYSRERHRRGGFASKESARRHLQMSESLLGITWDGLPSPRRCSSALGYPSYGQGYQRSE